MYQLFERGTIHRELFPPNLPTVTTLSSVMDSADIWSDVRVVTLREWAMELARDEATRTAKTIEELSPITDQLANCRYNLQRPFVNIEHNSITVGVDYSCISDEAVTAAIMMLTSIQDFFTPCFYEFGKYVDTAIDKPNQ